MRGQKRRKGEGRKEGRAMREKRLNKDQVELGTEKILEDDRPVQQETSVISKKDEEGIEAWKGDQKSDRFVSLQSSEAVCSALDVA